MNRPGLSLPILGGISAGGYLLAAAARGQVGFPLDDAWIHQVYARNWGLSGEFAFFPGMPSAGSTSPLWTMLIAPSHALGLDYRAWTWLLGALLLVATAAVGARFAFRLSSRLSLDQAPLIAWLVSALLLLEWHLAWSAVSGMEIPLFAFLSLLLMEQFSAGARRWTLGAISGLLTLARPEGIVLAAMVGAGILGRRRESKQIVAFVAVLGFLLWPYFAFNLVTSGTLLPNTFYAKAAEYSSVFERISFPIRWAQLCVVPWVGGQILLLPGFAYAAFVLARKREWIGLIPIAWSVALPALYAARLPVAYQHGRYEMPVIPVIVVYGVLGTAMLFERIRNRVVRRTWALSAGSLFLAFWILGASAYSTDVGIIDCEMVQTARWVASNAPAGALLAAHDIGALGFLYPYPFIDLAGLVSPEVVPFLRDERRLRDYLVARRANYAIFFPDWYPTLAGDPQFIVAHAQECSATRDAGGTSMKVYQIVPKGE